MDNLFKIIAELHNTTETDFVGSVEMMKGKLPGASFYTLNYIIQNQLCWASYLLIPIRKVIITQLTHPINNRKKHLKPERSLFLFCTVYEVTSCLKRNTPTALKLTWWGTQGGLSRARMCERRPRGGGKSSVLGSMQLQNSCGGRKKKNPRWIICGWGEVKNESKKSRWQHVIKKKNPNYSG